MKTRRLREVRRLVLVTFSVPQGFFSRSCLCHSERRQSGCFPSRKWQKDTQSSPQWGSTGKDEKEEVWNHREGLSPSHNMAPQPWESSRPFALGLQNLKSEETSLHCFRSTWILLFRSEKEGSRCNLTSSSLEMHVKTQPFCSSSLVWGF